MSEIDISNCSVIQLRTELKKLGLNSSGTKNALIERYKAYFEGNKEISIVKDTEKPVTEETIPEQPISTTVKYPVKIPEKIGIFT